MLNVTVIKLCVCSHMCCSAAADVCACVCVRACVRACACVCVCVCCVFGWTLLSGLAGSAEADSKANQTYVSEYLS